jgi:hypothetical protein
MAIGNIVRDFNQAKHTRRSFLWLRIVSINSWIVEKLAFAATAQLPAEPYTYMTPHHFMASKHKATESNSPTRVERHFGSSYWHC